MAQRCWAPLPLPLSLDPSDVWRPRRLLLRMPQRRLSACCLQADTLLVVACARPDLVAKAVCMRACVKPNTCKPPLHTSLRPLAEWLLLLQADKLLVFAHHQGVLDSLEEHLKKVSQPASQSATRVCLFFKSTYGLCVSGTARGLLLMGDVGRTAGRHGAFVPCKCSIRRHDASSMYAPP